MGTNEAPIRGWNKDTTIEEVPEVLDGRQNPNVRSDRIIMN
jgi:hypothetical protein